MNYTATVDVSALTLPDLARMMRAAMRERRWGETPIGERVGDYLDALEYAGASVNTLDAYEHVLGLFALEHADLSLPDLLPPDGAATVRGFLDRHWSRSAPATRRQRLAIVRAFCKWLVGEGLLQASPATNIRAPREKRVERRTLTRGEVERRTPTHGRSGPVRIHRGPRSRPAASPP